MFEGCVDKGSKEYKELCSRFNTSLSHMEIIFHSWWKTHDDGSWPSDDFIKGKLYGERVEMSDRSIYVAEENGYFNSKEFSDRKEAESYYRRLAGLYPKRAIGSYTNSGGKVVIVLSKPIISSDSKYKNLKKPAIGGAIEIGGNIQAITGVQKRTDKEFLVSTENGFISVNIREGGKFTDRAGNELIITGAVPYYSEYESNGKEIVSIIEQVSREEPHIEESSSIGNKQNKEEYGQRRIYTESISATIRKGWKEIGRSTKESSSKGLQGQDRDQGRNSTRSGRLLDDVVAEANDSLDKELSSRGIKATKQKIRVATSEEFHKAISEEKEKNPDGFMIDVHNQSDYDNDICFLTEDGKSGIAVTPEGDIISVFSSVKGDHRLDKLMFMAIAAGGKKLDCYYTDKDSHSLARLYSRFGFRTASVVPFNKEYAEWYDEWKNNYTNINILGVAAMYLEQSSPLDTYDLERSPQTETAPSFEDYNEALEKRDSIIDSIDEARQKSMQELQKEQTEGQKKEINKNQEFIDKNVALSTSIDNLLTSKVLTTTEVNEVASQMVNWISDQLTDIQNGKEETLDKYRDALKDLDLKTASRIDIARAIGPMKLVKDCKEAFLSSQTSGVSFKTALKLQVINNNWDALIYLAKSTFMENERFSIINNGTIIEAKEEDNADNFNDSKDPDDIKEDQGSTQENWQIEARTRDIIQHATASVRDALRQCYITDENDNIIKTEFGINRRVPVHKAVESICRWTQGAQDIDDMIDMLEAKVDSNPWINKIIERLKDRSGKEADFQSQFFVSFCLRDQYYSVVKAVKGADGKVTFRSMIVNKSPALKEVFKSIVNQFKIGEHPLFTSKGVNKSALKQLTEALNNLSHAENKETIDSVLTFVYHTLGYYANKKDIADITKDDKTIKKLINSLGYIVKKLTDHIDDSNYQPFTFNRNQEAGSIYGDIRNMLKPLTDRLEDTAISSFYEYGKMYQTHTLPSYLTNLLAKFHQKDETKFEEFIMKQYGSSEWFKEQTGDISTGWRIPWLDRMINDESGEARRIFEHKVQLTFNKQAYMTELGNLQYLLSILTEYSCEGSDNIAWYRVPMLSNKTSSEFIKFYKYTGSKYKDSITLGMVDIMLQEIARIRTVKIRNLKKGDKGFIKNWDTKGISFNLLSFLNQYLTPEGKKTEFGKLLEQATSKEGLSDKDTATLIVKAKEIIKKEMQKKVNSIMEKFEADGIVEAASNIQNFGNSKEEILNNLENFIWNDTFAAMNILELTITDPAYYDGAVDLQKRFAQIHAPGSRPNIKATDYKGNRVADRYSRTFVVNDFKGVISNIVENLTIVFDRKIEAATSAVEREMYKNMKEKIIKQFKDINVTDAQAYNCPTSYRKKAILFGRWSPEKEEIYQKLLKGDYNFSDLEVAFGEVLKPFVYTQTTESVGMENSPIQSIPVPFQNKNSEYLLIMADALLKGENTGRPNLLRVIYEVMEKSAEDNPTRGIDTVQFDSAVKSGLHDAISIHQFIDMPNISDAREKERLAKEHILNSIYEGDPTDHTKRTTKYKSSVRLIDWMDYGIQQEVPQHFNNHEQAHGSQIRAITPSELEEDAKFNVEGRFLSAKEFAKEYEDTIAENIRESLQELEKKFNIQGTRKERNIALAKILQEELESSPRYGIDLKQACLLNKDGEFNMPLEDPIQAKRIEQLINSIIKNTVNKQTIAGGPVVQVSNFGTSKELNIRFKNKNSKSKEDELLLTRDEWESNPIGESYEQYIKDNQGGIAYLEVYAPIYSNELFQRFTKPDGTIDIEVIEKLDPDLLKIVGYRIPTEDKYSCAPLKIVGFLPREAGDGIMLPYEITLLSGSDFDVDKIYIMRKDCNIRTDLNKIRKALFDKLKNSQNGKLSEGLRKSLKDLIDQFMLDPYRKESLVNQTTAKGYISIPESAYNILLEAYEELLRNPEYLTVEWPKEGRTYRNNKIVDMTYEVLTHEDSADKLLNPGGFDQQKRMGYMVAAIKRMGGLAMSPDELTDIWERLESMDINELNSLSSSDMNLAFIDTHVQFYKQNSAAAALIGIFAVHKVAHAIIERDPIYINFASASKLDVPMSIGGTVLATIKEDNVLKQLTKIDPRTDSSGALIGKTLGSLVASAADAAKDPVLNLMNINRDTANTLNMAIRLGIPFDNAALLLSQKCMTDILDKLNKGRLKNIPTSLKSVIKDRIDEIKKNLGMTKKGAANKVLEEGISKQELIMGLVSSDIKLELKALSYIQALLNINNELKEVTLATRFNSISSAVGPLIVDNLIVENQMKKFSKYIYVFNDTAKNYIKIESIHDILNMHPILQGFSRGYVEARRIMQDMPLYSLDFANIMNAVEGFGNPSIIENRSNLSKFADFYNSYLLVANGVIDPGDCSYYVTEFPKEFFFKKNFKERFEGNPFVDAMKLDIDPRTGIASIKIDITGLDNDQKSILMSGYIDLLNKDKELAIDLFKYNFFTGGLGFTPKTFMSLTPLLLKQAIDGYKECFSSRVSSDPRDVIDLFIRNNWSNNDFVKFLPPTSKKKDKKTHQTKEVPNFVINSEGTSITISNDWGLYSRYATQGYIRTVINNKEKLFKRAYDDADSGILIYVEVKPLGGKNSYLEFTNDPISVSDNISGEDNDNGIRKNPTKEGVVASEEPQPSLDTPSISDVKRAIAAVGLSEDAVTEKLDSFKRNSTEEKQSLKPAIIGFLAKQYTKLNIPFDEDKLNKDFEKMC